LHGVKPTVALTAILLLAGCLNAPKEGTPVDDLAATAWAELALPYGEDHDHFKVEQHQNLTTPNFQIIGFDPLVSPTLGRTPGGHHCGDAQQTTGGKRLAVVEMRNLGGFMVVDVTDPADPQWLGEFVMRTTRVYDAAMVPDGKHVLLVTTEQTPAGPLPVPPIAGDSGIDWRDACTGKTTPLMASVEDPVPRPFSLLLVSIENPAAPAILDQRPIPRNGHSAYATIIDGKYWILISVYGVQNGYDYFQFYDLSDSPTGKKLSLQGTHVLRGGVPSAEPLRVHDGWIAKHPKTGKVTAYLAGGSVFETLDISDPKQPKPLGRWSDWTPERNAFSAAMHSVFPLTELWDGRHYTVLGPEFGGKPGPQPSGTLWVLDTTDPAKPFAVAAWTLPHDVEWSGQYMFSNHYFSVVNRTLFSSMYHGGVWAIDLGALVPGNFTLLPSIGVFMPDDVSPKPPSTISRWTPTLQEILNMPDGSLVTFDGSAGLYTLRFDASRPMASPEPWPIPAWGTKPN
jgi:hypothetical protein